MSFADMPIVRIKKDIAITIFALPICSSENNIHRPSNKRNSAGATYGNINPPYLIL
jgi:hypothetical protein